jgi:hypothetical protein
MLAPMSEWRRPNLYDRLPDVRDGLSRVERVVLYELHRAQQEYKGRSVPTAVLYGRVVEHVNLTPHELELLLARLSGQRVGTEDER